MKFFNIIILLFASNISLLGQNNKQVHRFFIDKNTNTPISYANLINLDTINIGTTTNEKGKASFFTKEWRKNDKLYISVLGYKDTICDFGEKDTDSIYLTPKIYHIPEVQIFSKNTQKQIGSFERKIDNTTTGLSFNYAGMAHGVLVIPKRKDVGKTIKSVYYFIADSGPLESSFSLRMIKPKDRIKDNMIYTMNNFDDMHKLPIVTKSVERGWNRIDIEQQNIKIPDEPFVILISILYTGEHLKWKLNQIQNYGASLGYYEEIKLPQMKSCIQLKEKLSVIYDGDKGPIPAIVISYNAE